MNTRQTLILGRERFRVRAWHADPSTAYLTLLGDHARPTIDGLRECLDRIREQGYSSVMTSALNYGEIAPFEALGFEEFDRLRVLRHDLDQRWIERRPDVLGVRLRRSRLSDRPAALAVDNAAFPALWRLDAEALDEAVHATPRVRFRVADGAAGLVGYAVTGRAGNQAFLQRLAVDPAEHGRGIGTALVLDALQWATRRRVTRVLVNTQDDNDRALDLYRSLGFILTTTDLVVVRRAL